MTRPPDWQSRMAQALKTRRERPFAWGRHDCGLFACDIAEAISGVDLAAALRGRYSTRRGAFRALKSFAGGGIETAIEKIAKDHGCAEVPPLMAQRGDILLAEVLVHSEVLEDSLGVCLGETAAFAAAQGFVQLPIAQARRAWRVS